MPLQLNTRSRQMGHSTILSALGIMCLMGLLTFAFDAVTGYYRKQAPGSKTIIEIRLNSAAEQAR